MYITISYYEGAVLPEHANLQTHLVKEQDKVIAYAVEDKGVSFMSLDDTCTAQRTRFDKEEALVAIRIMGISPEENVVLYP